MRKDCKTCGEFFHTKVINKVYCSKKCVPSPPVSRYKTLGLSCGTSGALSELRVAIDLMEKGYDVYRALSPSSGCDLLAVKDGKTFTFEVRTGTFNPLSNKTYWSRANCRAERYGIYVPNTEELFYSPKLS